MGFRGAHKGYLYQDIVSAYILSCLLYKNDNTLFRVDEKDQKIDNIDDLKITFDNFKVNYQIKYSKARTLCLGDFKNDGDLSISKFIDYSKSDNYHNEFCLVLKWKYPTDKLKDFLYETEYNYSFGLSKVYKFKDEKLNELIELLSLEKSDDNKSILSDIYILIDSPSSSGDMYNPDVLEKNLKISCRNLGIGFFPNDDIVIEDFAIKLIEYITMHRSNSKFTFTIKEALNYLNVKCNYGKVPESFEINYEFFTSETKKVENLNFNILSNEKNIVIGEPGSGKSYLLNQLEKYYIENDINYIHHYLFTGLIDEYSEKRIQPNYIIGNLINELLEKFPEMKCKYNSFEVSMDKLNSILELINEKLVIFIDGIDHAFRQYGNQQDKKEMIGCLSSIKTSPNVHLVLVSQPLNELFDLNYNVIKVNSWTKSEANALIKKINPNITDINMDIIYEKSCGNPLYLTYLLVYSLEKDISDCPQYTGNILDYYKFLEKDISSWFYFIKYLVSIPFYFQKEEFMEISNSGTEGDTFINSIRPLLVYDTINRGYKIYHESFKRYIYDRCEEKKINFSRTKKEVVEWLENQNFFENQKSYFNLIPMLYELKELEKIKSRCSLEYLIASAENAYTINECKKNLIYFKFACCDLHDFNFYLTYIVLVSSISQYEENGFSFLATKEFFNIYLALKGQYAFDKLIANSSISSKDKNSIVLSGIINGFNIDENLICESIQQDEQFYVDEEFMIRILLQKDKKLTIRSKINKYKLVDLYDAILFGDCLDTFANVESELGKMFLNFMLDDCTYQLKIDMYYIPKSESVYKFDYFENLLLINSYLVTHPNDERIIKEISLTNNFYNKVLLLVYKFTKERTRLLESGDLETYEQNCIRHLNDFLDNVDPFSGNPRACDFTDRAFRKLFTQLLLKPLLSFKIRINDYIDNMIKIKNKLVTTIRNSIIACISNEDLLTGILLLKKHSSYELILEKMLHEIEKDCVKQLYVYTSSSYLQIAYYYSFVDKQKAECLFKKGISYCFCYGDHKDIFFSEIIDSYQYGLELDNNFDKYSIDIVNAAYSLFYHTDGKEISGYVNEWFKIYEHHNSKGVLSYLTMNINDYRSWIDNKIIADYIESHYTEIEVRKLVLLIVVGKFKSHDFDYEIIPYIIDILSSSSDKHLIDILYEYLNSIALQIPKYIIDKINTKLEDIKYDILEYNDTNLVNTDSIYSDTTIIKKNITIDEFFVSDNFEEYTIDSIYNLFNTVDFTEQFIDKLIFYFDKYTHGIDYLDSIFENNDFSEDKKLVLNVLYFYFRKDGWYKSFLKYEYMNKATEINSCKACDFLFEVIKKTRDIFHGYSGLTNPKLLINKNKIVCIDSLIVNGLTRIPDRIEKFTIDMFKTSDDCNNLIDKIIIKHMNNYHLDNRVLILSYIEYRISINDYGFIVAYWDELNLAAKVEILSVFSKLKCKIEIDEKKSLFIRAFFESNINVDYGVDLNYSNENEFYFCNFIFDSQKIKNFCGKYGISFRLFMKHFSLAKNEKKYEEVSRQYYSLATKRLVENQILFDSYINAIDGFVNEIFDLNIVKLDDIHSLSELIILPLANNYIVYNHKKTASNLNLVAKFESNGESNSGDFPKTRKHIYFTTCSNIIKNNFDKLNNGIDYQKNLLLYLDDNVLDKHKINIVNDKGIIKYYFNENLEGIYKLTKKDIHGLSEPYDLYYEKEYGELYLSNLIIDILKINIKELITYEYVIEIV